MRRALLFSLVLFPHVGVAQAPQAAPTPRRLPAPVAVSPRFLGSVVSVRELASGDLLVNDVRNHRVMRSDSLLRTTTVVVDSTAYGSRGAALLAYPGDSSLLIESVTPSMTLIDAAGRVGRSMSVPRPKDVGWLMPSPVARPGIDARGRLIRRGLTSQPPSRKLSEGEQEPFVFADTFPLMRDDPLTRRSDTVAWIRTFRTRGVRVGRADGGTHTFSAGDPLPILDDWAVMADGTIAVVRGREYRVVTIDANGMVTTHAKIPYEWEPMSDSAKVLFADSLRIARAARDSAEREMASSSNGIGNASSAGTGSGGMSLAGRRPADWPSPPPGLFDVDPLTLPDYRPVFGIGATLPDADGNLWVRTLLPYSEPNVWVYDVINREGRRIDRVLVPKNRTIVGFDRRGCVYLVAKEESGAQVIERVRWRP